MIFAALIFLQAGTAAFEHFPGSDWISESTTQRVQPYWDCAHEAAERFERSGESADIIAIAAKAECRERYLDLWSSYMADVIISNQKQDAQPAFDAFESDLRASIIHQVVVERVSRKIQ